MPIIFDANGEIPICSPDLMFKSLPASYSRESVIKTCFAKTAENDTNQLRYDATFNF